jgi:hypothetical protein
MSTFLCFGKAGQALSANFDIPVSLLKMNPNKSYHHGCFVFILLLAMNNGKQQQ